MSALRRSARSVAHAGGPPLEMKEGDNFSSRAAASLEHSVSDAPYAVSEAGERARGGQGDLRNTRPATSLINTNRRPRAKGRSAVSSSDTELEVSSSEAGELARGGNGELRNTLNSRPVTSLSNSTRIGRQRKCMSVLDWTPCCASRRSTLKAENLSAAPRSPRERAGRRMSGAGRRWACRA
eukprot:CAMPEP_0180259084 /NCGR_PEP_ID=MMETSP0987-20121128/42798_1 /TAXON_ID=697907 /ORGANISM="non described non described, Strain CCMP2293" /LENGTH=181 /DNA_ID=CAMNT_0022228701 /DNA_START=32 /DNA_END=575 /DNA_ORIENTATION=-